MRPWKQEIFTALENYIDRCLSEEGTAPTLQEIEAATGIPRATAARYMKKLQAEGRLVYAGCRRMQTEKSLRRKAESVSVPVLGAVACGLPKFAEENIEEYVSLPVSWLGQGEFYALRADGLSMKNIGILPGDIVLVRRQTTAEPGEVVVALVDENTATLKRYRPLPEQKRIELVPENEAFAVQTVDPAVQAFSIQGVAVKVLKDIPAAAL